MTPREQALEAIWDVLKDYCTHKPGVVICSTCQDIYGAIAAALASSEHGPRPLGLSGAMSPREQALELALWEFVNAYDSVPHAQPMWWRRMSEAKIGALTALASSERSPRPIECVMRRDGLCRVHTDAQGRHGAFERCDLSNATVIDRLP